MSEKSDEVDRAFDEASKEDAAATSGESEIHRVDTVPPPESGDAYSADTVVRDIPPEALDALRASRKSSEKNRLPVNTDLSPKATAPGSDRPTTPAHVLEAPKAAAIPLVEKLPAKEADPIERAEAKAAPPVLHVHSKIAPPVTASELIIAIAGAIAAIVIAFYAIGSAF